MITRMRNGLAGLRADFRAPLPGEERLSRFGRVRLRTRRVISKYGWKLALGFFVFYLIRDVALYLLLPYLALTFVW